MITKILDKYYNKQLEKYIKTIMVYWMLDYRFTENKFYKRLEVKKSKYKDSEYRIVYVWHKKDVLYLIADLRELRKNIISKVDKYLEGDK